MFGAAALEFRVPNSINVHPPWGPGAPPSAPPGPARILTELEILHATPQATHQRLFPKNENILDVCCDLYMGVSD